MDKSILIKRASLDNIKEILPLLIAYRQFYGHACKNKDEMQIFVTERLKRNEAMIFLAYNKEKAIGFTQLYTNFTTVGLGKIWILNDLYVEPKYRSKGIGKKLIDTVTRFAKEDGAIRVDLKTKHDNILAKTLYKKYGFKQDDTFIHFQYSLNN